MNLAQEPGFPRFLRENAIWLSAGFLITFSSSFGQTFFISIFAGQIMAEFSLSHGAWGGIYMAATTVSAIAMVWAGTLTDRYRVRVLAPGMLVLLAFACLSMALAQSLFVLVLAVFSLRFCGQGMLSHIATVAMARWYVAQRGRALSIAAMGFGVGEAVLPLMFVSLLAFAGWRSLWGLAAVLSLLAVPLVLRMMRHERTPQSIASTSESAGLQGRHWTRSEVLRHPLFWAAIPMVVGVSAGLTALFFHQVHLAAEKGWTHAQFVALFPIYTIGGIAVMLLAGWAIDRFGTARLVFWYLMPSVVGLFILWSFDSLWAGAISMGLIGASHGASSTIMAAFWAEFFGTRHLGAVRSLVGAVSVFGSAVGPGLTGVWIDWGVSFPEQLPAIAIWFVGSSVLLWVAVRRAAHSRFAT